MGWSGDLRIFGGLKALDSAIAATGAEALVITMPDAPGTKIRQVVDAALERGLDVRTVPSMSDLLDGTLDAYRVRRVQVEDLLRRTTATEHAAAVHETIGDRVVLITGAGGSIGSELARQVFALGPRRLILVDRAESALYLVQRELEAKRVRRGHARRAACRSRQRRQSRRDGSPHLGRATGRHLPRRRLQARADDGGAPVRRRLTSTSAARMALLDAAIAYDVERFVLVSTDKAVRPTSVMGASKRVAEMLVAEAARRTGRPYVVGPVRQRPRLQRQRRPDLPGAAREGRAADDHAPRDDPLLHDHPRGGLARSSTRPRWAQAGDLFVLDMGEPVRIVDLARDLVRLAGRDPDTQPIEFIGLRPGEKLHEELFYAAERGRADDRRQGPAGDRRAAARPTCENRSDRLLSIATGEDARATFGPPFSTSRRDLETIGSTRNGRQRRAGSHPDRAGERRNTPLPAAAN